MIVIKLGGSLYGSPYLQQWLDQIAASDQPIIIVPGGGPFADQVRKAQQQHPINDANAHHMALLAMAQFGILLSGLQPQLTPYFFPNDQRNITQGKHIWIPSERIMLSASLAQDWTITSDSLALWFAQQINADQLYLIKSAPLASNQLSLTRAQHSHLIDSGFVDQHAKQHIHTILINAADHSMFLQLIAGGSQIGCKLNQ